MKVKIVKAEPLSPTAKLYTVEAAEGDYVFLPGQFFSFIIPKAAGPAGGLSSGASQSVRAYSICSLPEELPQVELCVRQVPGGVGTTWLAGNIGKVVQTSEVQGDFILPQEASRPLNFLASGTGIAPARPMIKTWLKQYAGSRVLLVYRFREPDEFLFKDELLRLAQSYEKFQLAAVAGFDEQDFAERVEKGHKGVKGACWFVVGPPNFVKQNTNQLEKLGYNKKDIVYDIWDAYD